MDLKLSRPSQARLDFVEGLKAFVAGALVPDLRREYEQWVTESGVDEAQLRQRAFMDDRFRRSKSYQSSRGLQRISQEAMWREVINGLSGRRAEIEDDLGSGPQEPIGSLTLDDNLPMPAYYDATDFHLQPGSYHRDGLAGPVYELGVATYTTHRYGRAGDEMGRALLSVLSELEMPTPKRTLYLGCGPAYKAYPVVNKFPAARHEAIDLAAPMLRYAHHRAAANHKAIHFHQMNAERLGFDDSQFDLVYCKLLLHEAPENAVARIISEAARVLRPGGILANLELPGYDALDPLSAYLMDWDTLHNGEPYWRAYHELDLCSVIEGAGLQALVKDAHSEWGGSKGNYMGKFQYQVTIGKKGDDRTACLHANGADNQSGTMK